MTKDNELHVTCSCHTHELHFERDYEDEMWYVSFWQRGYRFERVFAAAFEHPVERLGNSRAQRSAGVFRQNCGTHSLKAEKPALRGTTTDFRSLQDFGSLCLPQFLDPLFDLFQQQGLGVMPQPLAAQHLHRRQLLFRLRIFA
jgi:hypothetical protein